MLASSPRESIDSQRAFLTTGPDTVDESALSPEETEDLITTFACDDAREVLEFPPTLNNFQRMLVHRIASRVSTPRPAIDCIDALCTDTDSQPCSPPPSWACSTTARERNQRGRVVWSSPRRRKAPAPRHSTRAHRSLPRRRTPAVVSPSKNRSSACTHPTTLVLCAHFALDPDRASFDNFEATSLELDRR